MSLKIFFIGSVKFSEAIFRKLLQLDVEVVGLLTKKFSKFNSDFVDLSYLAKKYNIDFLKVLKANSKDAINFIRSKEPDVIFCVGWSEILSKEILNIAKFPVIGYHPAYLPKNRGRHPIVWALFLGLKETASTFFFMNEGVDSGDIISQRAVSISYEDNAYTLYNKLINVALSQVDDIIRGLKFNSLKVIKQNDKESNYWRKRSDLDSLIDFRMSSIAVYNLVRALTRPYIGADLNFKGKRYKVWRVKEEKIYLPNIEPGKVLDVEGRYILVKCYENAVWLLEHELVYIPKVGEYII